MKTASNTVKGFTAGSPDFYRLVGVAKDIFGDAALDMVTLSDAFGKRVESTADPLAKFGDQLGIIKDEVFLPLQLAFVKAFPHIKNVAILLGAHFKNAVSSLVESSIRLYLKWESLATVINNTKTALVNLVVGLGKVAKWIPGVGLTLFTAKALGSLVGINTASENSARISAMTSEELLEAFKEKMDKDAEALGISIETAANTKKTSDLLDKTSDTAPKFLDQSASLMNRSIGAHLGFTDDATLQDLVEELQAGNELALEQLRQSQDNVIVHHPATTSE